MDLVNDYLATAERVFDMPDLGMRQVPRITCADGVRLSVQASATHYARPRAYEGPWSHVEIGFPSERIEELIPYAEDPESPTATVYGYVPIEVVEAVILAHGGIKT